MCVCVGGGGGGGGGGLTTVKVSKSLITEFRSPSILSKSLVMPEAALFRIARWWLPSNIPSDVSRFSSSDLNRIVSTLVTVTYNYTVCTVTQCTQYFI